jgi:hypothetical protein
MKASGRNGSARPKITLSQPSAHVFPRILRSVIAAREEVEVSRIRAGTIRTSDHLSVLVTAFSRRGKPRSGLKPSVRLGRQASKDIAARQKARTPSNRIGVSLLAN